MKFVCCWNMSEFEMSGLPVVIVSTGCDSRCSLTGRLSTTTNTFPRAVPTHKHGLIKLSAKHNNSNIKLLQPVSKYTYFDIKLCIFCDLTGFESIPTARCPSDLSLPCLSRTRCHSLMRCALLCLSNPSAILCL